MNLDEYQKETKNAYKDNNIARSYKNAYENKMSLKNFNIKVISFLEKEIVEDFLSYLEKNNRLSGSILDIPVGTGKMTKILLDSGLVVTGCDISQNMIDMIDKELIKHSNLKELLVMDASSLNFSDNSFESVISIRLMHRVPTEIRQKILKEFYRVSEKNVIVSFGIDNVLQRFRIWIKKNIFKQEDSSPGRVNFKKLVKEIEAIGFEIIKHKYVLPILSNEIIFLLQKE